MSGRPSSVPVRLRREWAGVTILAGASAAVGSLLLSEWWTTSHGRTWLLIAGGLAAAELVLLRQWLHDNRPTDAAKLRTTLGVANGLTVLRGLLVAAVAGFLPLATPSGGGLWVPTALYAGAVVLDYADGFFARRLGEVTALGRRLDEAMDTVGLFVAPTLAVAYGQLPSWYLLVPLAKPLYVASLRAYRRLVAGELQPLPESSLRRGLAALQMSLTAVALSPPVGPPVTTVLAAVGVVPFVGMFARDWLAVTGVRR
ncbi:MAG: CDP-alcohol phosphatidyltransferase family protein [Halolamina sp.]